MSIGPRNFLVPSQLYVNAAAGVDPQALAHQAVTAINGALAALTAPCGVAFSAEFEDGKFAIDEPNNGVVSQLLVEQADNMADAQASVEQAVAAIAAELSGLGAPSSVVFWAEQREDNQYVFVEPA